MPGQCFGCGAEFSLLKKEHGCKNCGYSFCKKCLYEKSVPVPKRNNSKHHVCHKCFKILTGKAESVTVEANNDLPEAYLKRIAALKARESGESPQSSRGSAKPAASLRKLDKPDRDIAMRLQKLKEKDEPKEKVSDKDLNERLAHLKGIPQESTPKPTYWAPERRLQGEQVDDLLDEIASEVEIDSHRPDPVADVEERLAKLRWTNKATGVDHGMEGKQSVDGNNLNKVDKMEPKPKLYKKNIDQVTDGDMDMEGIQRVMAEVSREMELDAQRALVEMQRDEQLMTKLREIQKTKKSEPDTSESEVDNTIHGTDTHLPVMEDGDSDNENEDAAARRIIQRYLAEAKIDEVVGDVSSPHGSRQKKKKDRGTGRTSGLEEREPSPSKSVPKDVLVDSDYDDSDELPYCCICTEDAVIRCKDCDYDLYCQKCFRECHVEMGLTDHRTLPYKPPKGYR